MIDGALLSWLLTGIPLLGAVGSLLFWPNADRVKFFSILWSAVSCASIIGFTGYLAMPPEGFLPLYLLPMAAVISLLAQPAQDRKSTRLNSSHGYISYAVFCLKKKKKKTNKSNKI